MLISPHAPPEMYENEVRFYRDIRPALTMETPKIYAADFDKTSGQFGLIMEDLSQRHVVFPPIAAIFTVFRLKYCADRRTIATSVVSQRACRSATPEA